MDDFFWQERYCGDGFDTVIRAVSRRKWSKDDAGKLAAFVESLGVSPSPGTRGAIDVVSASDCGAAGDGAADDAPALMAADQIAALRARLESAEKALRELLGCLPRAASFLTEEARVHLAKYPEPPK